MKIKHSVKIQFITRAGYKLIDPPFVNLKMSVDV